MVDLVCDRCTVRMTLCTVKLHRLQARTLVHISRRALQVSVQIIKIHISRKKKQDEEVTNDASDGNSDEDSDVEVVGETEVRCDSELEKHCESANWLREMRRKTTHRTRI